MNTAEQLKGAILEQLGTGKDTAITGPELAYRLDKRNTRTIRLATC